MLALVVGRWGAGKCLWQRIGSNSNGSKRMYEMQKRKHTARIETRAYRNICVAQHCITEIVEIYMAHVCQQLNEWARVKNVI